MNGFVQNQKFAQLKSATRVKNLYGTLMLIHLRRSRLARGHAIPDEYLEMMRTIILSHRGHVQHLDATEILAVFPTAVLPHYHAAEAVSTALEIVRQTNNFNQYRNAPGQDDIRVSVGLDTLLPTGQAEDSTLHKKNQAEAVALVRHLCELNKQTPFPAAFLSANTYRILTPNRVWQIENLGFAYPPLTEQKVQVYAVLPPA